MFQRGISFQFGKIFEMHEIVSAIRDASALLQSTAQPLMPAVESYKQRAILKFKKSFHEDKDGYKKFRLYQRSTLYSSSQKKPSTSGERINDLSTKMARLKDLGSSLQVFKQNSIAVFNSNFRMIKRPWPASPW